MRRLLLVAALVLAVAISLCGQAEAPAEKAPAHQAQKAGEHTPPGEHAGEHGAEPNFWWKVLNFAILVGALGYYLGKKAGPFFRARTDEIRHGIDEAAAMKAGAERRAAEIEARLNRLDEEVAGLRDAARQEVAAEGERVRAETQEHIAKIRAGAEHEIEAAAKAARQRLRAWSAELALSLAEQKVRGRVTPDVELGLLDNFIRGLKQERVQ